MDTFGRCEVVVSDNKKYLITPSIRTLIDKIKAAFERDLSVLVRGGIGSEKSLIISLAAAEFNPAGNFVRINISTISPELLMSELFGHKKGSFSGAISDRLGLVSSAKNGILFIDEIGELTLEAQAALLDLLQEGYYRSVGSDNLSFFTGKIIVATHKNLKQMVKDGTFREDLYSRIKPAIINIPTMDERRGEIILFANFFLDQYNAKNKTDNPKKLGGGCENKLRAIGFKYGLRDIEGLIGAAHIKASRREYLLPSDFLDSCSDEGGKMLNFASLSDISTLSDFQISLGALQALEKVVLQSALNLSDGNKKQAAKLCGLPIGNYRASCLKHGIKETTSCKPVMNLPSPTPQNDTSLDISQELGEEISLNKPEQLETGILPAFINYGNSSIKWGL